MDDDAPCCSASRTDADSANVEATDGTTAANVDTSRMVRLDGETFTMGTDSDVGFPVDGEARPVS